MSLILQVTDSLRKPAASRVSVSPLSALCLWSRFPSPSSTVSPLRVDASGGLPALIAAKVLWTLCNGGRRHELKSSWFWKEAGTSARAENSSLQSSVPFSPRPRKSVLACSFLASPEYLIMAFPCTRATQDRVGGRQVKKKKSWMPSL